MRQHLSVPPSKISPKRVDAQMLLDKGWGSFYFAYNTTDVIGRLAQVPEKIYVPTYCETCGQQITHRLIDIEKVYAGKNWIKTYLMVCTLCEERAQ